MKSFNSTVNLRAVWRMLFIACTIQGIILPMDALDLHYSITAQQSQLSQLGLPSAVLDVLNKQNLTSSITITLATQPFTRTPDNVQIKQGVTVESGINMGSFLNNITQFVPVPTSLLSGTKVRINGPFTAKTVQDLDIRVGSSVATAPNAQEEPIKLSGLLSLVELNELPLGDELLAQLDEIDAQPTDYSLQYNKGTWRYDLKTNVNMFSIKNVALNILLEPATQEHAKKRVAVNIAIPTDDFGLSKISEHLAPFDETVTLTNPTITFANYDSDDDNTIEGVIIQAIANFGPPFDKLVAPNGKSDTVTITVKIPKTMKSAKDVTVNITSSAMQADKICVGDIMSKLGLATDMGPTQELFNKICLTNVIANVRLVGQDSAFEIHGNSDLFGQPQASTIYLQKRKEGIGVTFASDGRQDTPITLADIDSKLTPFDQAGSLSNWQFAFSNWENPEELLNFGKIAKGFTMTGTMTFTGYVGKFMQIFDLKQDDFLVTIPSGTDISGFKLIIQKPVNKSVGGSFLTFSTLNFGMQFTESTPPLPELMVSLAGIATIPGTPPHPFELEGELAPGEITLSGALTTESEESSESEGQGQAPSAKIRIAQSNLYIDKPTVSLSLAEGALTGFGGGGIMTVGSKQFEVYTKVDAEHPDKMALMFEAEDVGLSDIVNIWGAIIGKPGFKVTLPSIFTFDKFTAHYAPEEVVMPNMTIEKGFGADGTMTLFGTTFDILVDYGLFSGITIKAVGDKPMQMSPLLVISDSTGTKGPELDLELTFTNQQAVISGHAELAKIITGTANVLVTTQGASVDITGSVFGIDGEFKVQAPLNALTTKQFDQISVQGSLDAKLFTRIQDILKETLNNILSEANQVSQPVIDACTQTFGYLDVIGFDCKKCLSSMSPLGASQQLLQQALQAARFSIDRVDVATNLAQMQQQLSLPGITITMTLFGKTIKAGPFTLSATDPMSVVRQAVKTAITSAVTTTEVMSALGTSAIQSLTAATELTCASTIKIGTATAQATLHTAPATPQNSYIVMTVNQLSLADLLAFAAQISHATISLPNAQAIGIHQLLIRVDSSGMVCSGALDKINWDVLQITNTTGDQGPRFTCAISPSSQQLSINGRATFGGISVLTTLNIDPTGITFSSDQQLLGLSATMNVQAQLNNLENMGITYTVAQNITDIIKGRLEGTANSIKNSIGSTFSNISNTLSSIEDKCNQIPVVSGIVCAPLDTAKNLVNQSQNLLNQINSTFDQALNSINIQQITLSGKVSDLQKRILPQLTMQVVLTGQSQTISLQNISLDDTAAFYNKLTNAVLNLFNPQAEIKQLAANADQMKNLLKDAAALLAQAMQNMFKNLAQAVENVMKGTAQEVQQEAQTVANTAQNLATSSLQIAAQAEQNITNATSAAEKAVNQAEQAAQQAASQALQQAQQAATQAAQAAATAVEESTKAAAEAVAHAAKAIEEAAAQAASRAWHSVKHFFHHF